MLPHPSVQLAFDARAAAVHGVGTRCFVAQLEGSGRALSVKLEPGAFVAFSALPMAELVDRVLPIAEVFGARGSELAARVLGEPNTLDAIGGIEHFLRELAPTVCRARVQEAAERVSAGAQVDWAALAVELGYHDQAHFIHEFKAQIGFTPAAYASRCAAAARQREEPAR